MKTIGVLGGIASGKSAATEILRELGAEVFDADKAGHRVLEMPEVQEQIRERFSSAVFDSEGRISRPKLAKLVFGPDPEHREALLALEKISHPRIGKLLIEAQNHAASRGVPAFIVDAPVMIKASWIAQCDHVLFIEASRKVRLARALARKWTENEFDIREASQEKLEVKRQHADFVIPNENDLSQLRNEIQAFWRQHIATYPDCHGFPR